jgi:septum formation protein
MRPKNTLPLILASASPRRRELLQLAGIPLEIIPSQADERFLQGESPEEHVRRVARAKAMEVGRQHPGRWVLGADTVVAIDGRVLGKPGDSREAEEMLRDLSQREHRVLTGFCILRYPSMEERGGTVISRVKFKSLSPEEVRWYINTGEPFDKAGGYAIQGKGAFMVKEVHGSYTNVVGLPLCEVVEALRELGAVNLFATEHTEVPAQHSRNQKLT